NLEIPEGMAVIMRTAGVERNKAEVRRDYEYLRRTWDDIREQTLKSSALSMIYEDGDLVKRSLRDVYNREIEEIVVDGEAAYKAARTLMRTMMPSHVKRIKKYADNDIPLYHRYNIEQQLDEIYDPIVRLRSGGYIVINPTEALVAIDVNSGRSTKERNIEETALKTNLEAASEVGRQLRLRDLAGLVVIDFIDMDENRNNRAVERRMKEALKDDRARIQVGRISSFGLMEMSRQRLRPSLFEASTRTCDICTGTGFVRTTESTALHVLRAIEEEGIRGRAAQLTVHAPAEVALYMLNQKRDHLAEIEQRYGMGVHVLGDDTLISPDCRVDIDHTRTAEEIEESERKSTAALLPGLDDDDALATNEAAGEADSAEESADGVEKTKEKRPRRRRRSRRRNDDKGEDKKAKDGSDNTAASESGGNASGGPAVAAATETDADGEEKTRQRRRGRRGRRRRRGGGDEAEATEAAANADDATGETANDTVAGEAEPALVADSPASEGAPAKPIGFTASGMMGREAPAHTTNADTADSDSKATAGDDAATDDAAPDAILVSATIEPEAEAATETVEAAPAEETPGEEVAAEEASDKPKRRGWWQRGRLF
ncbi:MAG: Rne/Rng family ribonuclease, partial [Alphaproteobacteria bacterium]|nr:Rne/Rng family ribonuclease [Alphaproteobacteria bacterium]